MFYLAWQTLFWLVLAILFGLFLGWLFWGRRSTSGDTEARGQVQQQTAEVDRLKAELTTCVQKNELYQRELNQIRPELKQKMAEVDRLKADLEACGQKLESYRLELEQASRQERTPVPADVIPPAVSGQVDDLKEIVGVGPYLEGKLNGFGIHTFRQVASLTPAVIGQLGATFGSFSDRITREDWIGQAKKLHQAKYGEKL